MSSNYSSESDHEVGDHSELQGAPTSGAPVSAPPVSAPPVSAPPASAPPSSGAPVVGVPASELLPAAANVIAASYTAGPAPAPHLSAPHAAAVPPADTVALLRAAVAAALEKGDFAASANFSASLVSLEAARERQAHEALQHRLDRDHKVATLKEDRRSATTFGGALDPRRELDKDAKLAADICAKVTENLRSSCAAAGVQPLGANSSTGALKMCYELALRATQYSSQHHRDAAAPALSAMLGEDLLPLKRRIAKMGGLPDAEEKIIALLDETLNNDKARRAVRENIDAQFGQMESETLAAYHARAVRLEADALESTKLEPAERRAVARAMAFAYVQGLKSQAVYSDALAYLRTPAGLDAALGASSVSDHLYTICLSFETHDQLRQARAAYNGRATPRSYGVAALDRPSSESEEDAVAAVAPFAKVVQRGSTPFANPCAFCLELGVERRNIRHTMPQCYKIRDYKEHRASSSSKDPRGPSQKTGKAGRKDPGGNAGDSAAIAAPAPLRRTFLVQAHAGGALTEPTTLNGLPDTGSSLDVISPARAQELGITITPPAAPLTARTVGGTVSVVGTGLLRLSVAGREALVQFHMLDHGQPGCDVILSERTLEALGWTIRAPPGATETTPGGRAGAQAAAVAPDFDPPDSLAFQDGELQAERVPAPAARAQEPSSIREPPIAAVGALIPPSSGKRGPGTVSDGPTLRTKGEVANPEDDWMPFTDSDGTILFNYSKSFSAENTYLWDEQLEAIAVAMRANQRCPVPSPAMPKIKVAVKPGVSKSELPFFVNGYPMSNEDYSIAIGLADNLCEAGLWERVDALDVRGDPVRPEGTTCSPGFLVHQNGKPRLVVDNTRLNALLDTFYYYGLKPADLKEIQERHAARTLVSKSDCAGGYHQIPLASADDGSLTLLVSVRGTIFKMKTLTMGLSRSPEVFQMIVRAILAEHLARPAPGTDVDAFYDDLYASSDLETIVVEGREMHDVRRHTRLWVDIIEACNGTREGVPSLVLSGRKTFLFGRHLELGGIVVGSGEKAIPRSKLIDIGELRVPTTAKEAKSSLAVLRYVSDHAPLVSAELKGFDRLVNTKGEFAEVVDPAELADATDGFNRAKAAILAAPPLQALLPGTVLGLISDSSGTRCGNTLIQFPPGTTHVDPIALEDPVWVRSHTVAFHSQAFPLAKLHYAAGAKELIGIVAGVRAWENVIRSRQVIVFNDNQPLITALASSSEPKSAYMLRVIEYLNAFDLFFCKVPGTADAGLVDTLSRAGHILDDEGRRDAWIEPAYLTLRAERPATAAQELSVAAISTRRAAREMGPRTGGRGTLKPEQVETGTAAHDPGEPDTVPERSGLGAPIPPGLRDTPGAPGPAEPTKLEPWVPEFHGDALIMPAASRRLAEKYAEGYNFVPPSGLRAEIVTMAHRLAGHRGGNATAFSLRAAGFWWPEAAKDCAAEKSQCTVCLRRDVARHGYNPPREDLSQRRILDEVHIDYLKVPRDQHGYEYLALARDSVTGFVWLLACRDKGHGNIVRLLQDRVLPFGFPTAIISDNEIVGQEVAHAIRDINAVQKLITPYRPATNGRAEAGVKLVKDVLLRMIDEWDITSWSDQAWLVAVILNNQVLGRTGSTPFSLMLKRANRPVYEYTPEGDHKPLTPEQWTAFEREQVAIADRFVKIVEPGLSARQKLYDERTAAVLRKRPTATFAPGDFVYVEEVSEDRIKGAPRRNGPFEVAARTHHNNYYLFDPAKPGQRAQLMVDSQGRARRFPPEHLLRCGPGFVHRDGETRWYIEEILDDRVGAKGQREFYVRWKGFAERTWIPAKDFDSHEMIDTYDREKRRASNTAPGKRGRRPKSTA